MALSESYMPVDPDFYEDIENLIKKDKEVKVFFFTGDTELDSATGKIKGTVIENRAEYLRLHSNRLIRLDRIIVLDGKPGPMYDYYDSFSNACLDCRVEFNG